MYKVILEGQKYNRIEFEFKDLVSASDFISIALRNSDGTFAIVSEVKEEVKDGEEFEF